MGDTAGVPQEIGALSVRSLIVSACILIGAPLALAEECVEPSDLAGQDGERNFVQTRNLAGVPAPLTSSGHVSFSDQEIVWTVTSPLTIETRIAPAGMTQSIEGGDPEPVGAGGADNPLLSDSGLLELIRGDLSRLEERYDVVHEGPETGWSLTLTPKLAEMAQYVSGVSIKGCAAVDYIEVIQSNGDRISVAFKTQE